MYGRVLFFLSLFFWGTCLSAAPSAISLVLDGASIQPLTDLRSGNTNRTLAVLIVDSTSSSSFTISIASAKNGAFVRKVGGAYITPILTGDSLPYTFTMEGNGTGTLGCTEPPLPINATLSTTPLDLAFTNRTTDTVGKEYLFRFTVPSKTSLFGGTFADDLTVTISDT